MEIDDVPLDSLKCIKSRLIPAVACLLSAGACLAYAKLRGELPDWWRSFGGGIPYVLFWILFAYTLLPKPSLILRICIAVVMAICGLEVLQLWNPGPLASFRSTKFGAALLGSTFVWNDFPPYFIGGAMGYSILKLIGEKGLTIERTQAVDKSSKA